MHNGASFAEQGRASVRRRMDKKIMLGVGAATATVVAGSLAYLLLKDNGSLGISCGKTGHVSSSPVYIDVKIPSEYKGLIIGFRGDNIRELQHKTNTRIVFKDELETETHAVVKIRGQPEDAQMAEILIHQIIANQRNIETMILMVPSYSVGFIIGQGGDTIRRIQTTSKCKIDVERVSGGRTRKVTLKGTSEQISFAKELIDEKVMIASEKMSKGSDLKSSQLSSLSANDGFGASIKSSLLCLMSETSEDEVLSQNDLKNHTEKLWKEGMDQSTALLEVYVSSVTDPNHFYVQKTGPESIALDRLTQDMTNFYDVSDNRQSNAVEEINVGDLVAAKFSSDNHWYRARVHSVERNEYNTEESEIDLDFVDFGDCERKTMKTLCQLRPEFLKLKFQAVACRLANVEPQSDDGVWSEAAADEFHGLTHAAQWKVVLARLKGFVPDEKVDGAGTPLVELIDASSSQDVNIGSELARLDLAVYKE